MLDARIDELRDSLENHRRSITAEGVARGLIHELNQRLFAIANFAQGCCDLIERGEASPKDLQAPLRRITEISLNSGDELRRLCGSSLQPNQEAETVDVNDLVRGVATAITPEAQRRNVRLTLSLLEPGPMVLVTVDRIQQVILNLIRNGFDALSDIDPARREVNICTEFSTDTNQIAITVSDRGEGFSAESAPQIFRPFFSTTTDGLGIGLSISRAIVEAHGGSLTASSIPGDGAEFRFSLPICMSRASDVAA